MAPLPRRNPAYDIVLLAKTRRTCTVKERPMPSDLQQPSPLPDPGPVPLPGDLPPEFDPDEPAPVEEPPEADPIPTPGDPDVPPLRVVRL